MNEHEWLQLYLILFILSLSSQFPPTSIFTSATARVRRPPVQTGVSGLLLLLNGPINSLAQFQVVPFPKGAKGLLNNLITILLCLCLEICPRLGDGSVQYLSALCNHLLYCLVYLPVLLHDHGSYCLLDDPQYLSLGLISGGSKELIRNRNFHRELGFLLLLGPTPVIVLFR